MATAGPTTPGLGRTVRMGRPAPSRPLASTVASPYAPNPYGYAGYAQPQRELPQGVQNLLDFYQSGTSQRTLSQMASRPASGRTTTTYAGVQQARKPFQGVSAAPTVSPYLNLFRDEQGSELPNYYTFVRPQLQQQATNRAQQAELMRLRRQVQTMPLGNQATAMQNAPVSATGHGTRYLNTSHFYRSSNFQR